MADSIGRAGPCGRLCQLICVDSRGSGAAVRLWSRPPGGPWRSAPGEMRGFVGKCGVAARKTEGDGRTPAGLFRLGHAFGLCARPETAMPYRPVTPLSFWVDDPDSSRYNSWAEGGDWDSAERLSDYPDSYAYGVVIKYNMNPAVSGRGSAIFLHCGDRPTAGCVAVARADLLRILRWLRPDRHPHILLA